MYEKNLSVIGMKFENCGDLKFKVSLEGKTTTATDLS